MNKTPGVLALCLMVLGISFGLPPVVHGQKAIRVKIEKVKQNPAGYKWGEATDKDLERARSRSLADLISNIRVVIFSITNLDEEVSALDDSSHVRIEFENKIHTFSNLVLTGIKRYEEKVRKRKWKVFTYISQASLDESIKQREGKILDYMQAGLEATTEGRVSEALRNYYWGYLLTKSHPRNIKTDWGKTFNGPVEFTRLINATLEDIDIDPAGESYSVAGDLVIPLSCTIGDKPVTELTFKFFYKGKIEYGLVDDGESKMVLPGASDGPVRDLFLFIDYKAEGAISSDKEIALLESFFGQRSSFSNRKLVRFRVPRKQPEIDGTGGEETAESEGVEQPAYGQLPSFRTEAVYVLLENRNDLDVFKQILRQFNRLGDIHFLKAEDIKTCNDCILAVIDDGYIVDMLYYNGSVYIGIENEMIYEDVASQYRGKGLIWFQERQ